MNTEKEDLKWITMVRYIDRAPVFDVANFQDLREYIMEMNPETVDSTPGSYLLSYDEVARILVWLTAELSKSTLLHYRADTMHTLQNDTLTVTLALLFLFDWAQPQDRFLVRL